MCGIAAAYVQHNAIAVVRNMLALLRHRGDSSDPAQSVGGKCALGAERLCIVDSVRGQQPVWSWDREWCVAFNGEIYNHRALRCDLETRGVRFVTDCDSEVLANEVAVYGLGALNQLDGMFAFVAVHRSGLRFIAARDPMGVKPLYFARRDSGVIFASEIAPLLLQTDSDVECVMPGCFLTEKESGTYWSRSDCKDESTESVDKNADILGALLEDAVSKRIPEDLPCAILFSGGVDSTLVFHLARRINPMIRGYYIGNPNGLDWKYAERYAESTGADVTFVRYEDSHVLAMLPEVVRTLETFEPNQVRGGVFSYLLARQIRRDGYRVALCGEGADELFCGYPELQATNAADPEDAIRRTRNRFLDYLHRTQLQRVDRCSMRHQVEVRVPFLDRRIVEFANRLPLSQMVIPNSLEPHSNKIVLRHLYRRYPEIPEIFSTRSKVVLSEGAGMGNNAQEGPFFEHASTELPQVGSRRTRTAIAELLTTDEERFYYSILAEAINPMRISFLNDRPSVNVS